MERLIRASLERVIGFLEEQKISIGAFPTYTYINGYSPFSKKVLAQVPGELEQIRSIGEENNRRRGLKYLPAWYQKKGIFLSQEALSQSIEITLQRARTISALTDQAIANLNSYRTEMLFFRSVEDVFNANSSEKTEMIIDSIVAHEIWHVVEMRRGLLGFMAAEGTAEYSRIGFENWRQERLRKKTEYNLPDLLDDENGKNVLINLMGENIYDAGLKIVRRNVVSLAELLDPEKRQKIERDFLEYLDQWTAREVDKDDDHSYSQEAALVRMIFPEFNVLDQELSKQNLIAAQQLAGLTRMALELASQDCTLFLEHYRRMGFSE